MASTPRGQGEEAWGLALCRAGSLRESGRSSLSGSPPRASTLDRAGVGRRWLFRPCLSAGDSEGPPTGLRARPRSPAS